MRKIVGFVILLSVMLVGAAYAAVPLTINHQGIVKVSGEPFTGNGQFKFGFMDAANVWLWTNDSTHIGQSASVSPDVAVTIPVTNGVYNVRLGDTSLTGMTSIPSTVFDSADVKLRVLFNDGTHGEQVLSPDQSVTSSPFAFHASYADHTASDAMLASYRANCMVVPNDASSLTVLPGEIAVPNLAGTSVRYRRNSNSTSVTWADLDGGTEANDCEYYVYAVADDAAATFTVRVSTSAIAPSAMTYCRRLGYFYNDSSGDICDVGNTKGGDVANRVSVTGNTDLGIVATSYTDLEDTKVRFVSSGRPVSVRFSGIFVGSAGCPFLLVSVFVDGVKRIEKKQGQDPLEWGEMCLSWSGMVAAGVHEVKICGRGDGSNPAFQHGSDSPRELVVEEL